MVPGRSWRPNPSGRRHARLPARDQCILGGALAAAAEGLGAPQRYVPSGPHPEREPVATPGFQKHAQHEPTNCNPPYIPCLSVFAGVWGAVLRHLSRRSGLCVAGLVAAACRRTRVCCMLPALLRPASACAACRSPVAGLGCTWALRRSFTANRPRLQCAAGTPSCLSRSTPAVRLLPVPPCSPRTPSLAASYTCLYLLTHHIMYDALDISPASWPGHVVRLEVTRPNRPSRASLRPQFGWGGTLDVPKAPCTYCNTGLHTIPTPNTPNNQGAVDFSYCKGEPATCMPRPAPPASRRTSEPAAGGTAVRERRLLLACSCIDRGALRQCAAAGAARRYQRARARARRRSTNKPLATARRRPPGNCSAGNYMAYISHDCDSNNICKANYRCKECAQGTFAVAQPYRNIPDACTECPSPLTTNVSSGATGPEFCSGELQLAGRPIHLCAAPARAAARRHGRALPGAGGRYLRMRGGRPHGAGGAAAPRRGVGAAALYLHRDA